jgi:hypothetical protein
LWQDLELWFPDGDTLVYLSENPVPSRNPQGLYKPPPPQPSFRLRSSALRKTESPYLVSLLEESVRARPMTPVEPEIFSEEQLMDFEYQLRRTRTLELSSSAASARTESSVATEAGITYRLYFPAPSRHDKAMRHRYHLATRNFFAILFEKPLVGITIGQTLLDVMERIDKYLFTGPSPMEYDLADRGLSEIESPFGSFVSPGSVTKKTTHPHTVGLLLRYLQAREFGDVRNWAEGAAGLLVWSERIGSDDALRQSLPPHDQQQIESLWREAFVHCTGLLSSLQVLPEWREISPITKALIDRASLEIQVRVNQADSRMAAFNFSDMWPVSSAAPPPARLAFDRFQKFLVKHYASRFGSWPPAEGRFTRTLYLHLQRDFTTLYSYLVDQDAVWSDSRRGIVKPTNPAWRADDEALRITDILAAFDERENHPPIPHPFPLVPPSRTATGFSDKRAKGFSFTPSNPRNRNPGAAQAALALTESTNIEALRLSTTPNLLLEAFQAHEKSTPSHEIAPHDARKGRWIMIYGVLQTLASVAVDAPGVNWTEGVEYWVNPRLRDTPPWGRQNGSDERSHFRSHCWVLAGPQESVEHARRVRARSRSRSRRALKLQREQAARGVQRVAERVESSGDDGDDEMDSRESPAPEEAGVKGESM